VRVTAYLDQPRRTQALPFAVHLALACFGKSGSYAATPAWRPGVHGREACLTARS